MPVAISKILSHVVSCIGSCVIAAACLGLIDPSHVLISVALFGVSSALRVYALEQPQRRDRSDRSLPANAAGRVIVVGQPPPYSGDERSKLSRAQRRLALRYLAEQRGVPRVYANEAISASKSAPLVDSTSDPYAGPETAPWDPLAPFSEQLRSLKRAHASGTLTSDQFIAKVASLEKDNDPLRHIPDADRQRYTSLLPRGIDYADLDASDRFALIESYYRKHHKA